MLSLSFPPTISSFCCSQPLKDKELVVPGCFKIQELIFRSQNEIPLCSQLLAGL